MSLPPAQKDISDSPKTGAVTAPVDPKLKDADVDRKLRFYGVIQAFRQGRLPTNAQIDAALLYARENSPVSLDKLSPAGKKLIDDVRDIIETARLMVKEKNADELFQGFVWDSRNTNWDGHNVGKDDVPLSKDDFNNSGQQALTHLRTLLHLLLTNSEARKLLSDGSIIGRDLLSIGAQKAATAIAPSDHALRSVDDAAPADQFHTDEYGKPVLEARVPGTGHTVVSHPEEGVNLKTEDGQTKSPEELKAHGQALASDLASDAQARGQDHAADIQRDVNAAPEDEQTDVAKRGLKDKILGFRDNVLDRVPQEHKDRANEQVDRSKQFFTEEYFPKERRDQFIYRGKKVIIECQKHPEYQTSLQWLLDEIETYATHGRTIASTGKDGANNLAADPSLNKALNQFRTLLERFANNQSVDPILDSFTQIGNDAKEDEALRDWLKAVDAYVRKVLMEPGYILQPDCDSRANEIKESGRVYWNGKYKSHFDNVFDQIGKFFGAMGDDPLNARFGQDWARLSRDLLFDAEGKLTFKPELWGDIRKVILPQIIEKVGYVPIPRIEYTDDGLDLVVENLTLSGPNLFPNIVSLDAHNYIKFSPYDSVKDESHHDITLTFSHIQADLRDVAFYFRRKTGAIKLSDSGLADIILGGSGLTVSTHLRSAPATDASSVFHVQNVDAKIGDIKVAIRDSKHDILYKTIKPLIMGLVKKQIKKAVEDSVRTALEYVDGQLVGVRNRMEEAKVADDTTRIQALQDLFKKKADETQSIKSKADAHFKVGTNRDSVLLPNQGHPAGWVNRVSEKKEAANKGEEWRSDAFTIVEAM